jgi:hypothetical protein
MQDSRVGPHGRPQPLNLLDLSVERRIGLPPRTDQPVLELARLARHDGQEDLTLDI